MFDPHYALTVGIPVAQAAYDVQDENPFISPLFTVSTLIRAPGPHINPSKILLAMTRDTNIFGFVGRQGSNVYIGFRGSETVEDWLQDFTVIPTAFGQFGAVADGFLDVYQSVRSNLLYSLRDQLVSGDNILIVGHSLGGALAVLAALDISPVFHIEPAVLTFAAPRIGLHRFATTFNQKIESCWRVTNFLDIVPFVPPDPYMHCGTHVGVNSGGSILTRHDLQAYQVGLTKMFGESPRPDMRTES